MVIQDVKTVILVKIPVVVLDDVNSSIRDFSGFDGIYQCSGVYEFTTGAVDEKSALAHHGELLRVDHVVAHRHSGHMQGDGVAVVEQCFQVDELDDVVLLWVRREVAG